jgi:hypothetical protein
MPVIATRHDYDIETYRLGEPDRVANGVSLYTIGLWYKRLSDQDLISIAKSLGLVRVGSFDINYLSFWFTPATWPRSWLLKVWFWQGWHFLLWRILIREVLARHLYLIDWSPMQRCNSLFTWRECFKPFRWARLLLGVLRID